MRWIKLTALATVIAAPLAAQDGPPAGWMSRLDRPGASGSLEFNNMPPGFHLTTNSAAGVFYHPDSTASGQFRFSATVFLFDPGQRHREAYGIVFGGRDLQGAEQAYTYFLIRDSGEYLIKRRHGSTTSDVVGWTATDAVMKYPGGDEQARNTLSVVAGAENVEFYVNETMVRSVPRADLNVNGVVGFRANHGLNLHVAELKVERR